jgi:hypothetical protein
VYHFWDKNSNIIYIGVADGPGGLLYELELHQLHKHPIKVEGIYDFQVEVCRNPRERQAELLDSHEQKFGQLPKYNQQKM